jgi:hypothetical protein
VHVLSVVNTESNSEVSQPTLLEDVWLFGSGEGIAYGSGEEVAL